METVNKIKVSLVSLHIMEEAKKQTRDRIVSQADMLFLRYGARSVTMDDIAKGLGISKKTIYQYFNNKASIVQEIVRLRCEKEANDIREIVASSTNAAICLIETMRYSSEMFQTMSPQIIYEVKKYYPKAWELVEQHKEDFIIGMIKSNLHQGIKEGLYRKNINVDIVARMHTETVELGFDPRLFPPETYTLEQVENEVFKLFLYGIVTTKGAKIIRDSIDTSA